MRSPVCIPRHKHNPHDRFLPNGEAGYEQDCPNERHPQMELAGTEEFKLVHGQIL